MKMSICALLASSVLSIGGTAVLADPVLAMPNADYDFVAAKLLNDGFTAIHLVHGHENHIVATDPNGSEVMMIVDPAKHQIVSMTYVHMLDQ